MPRATVSLACLLWLTLGGVVPAQSDLTSETGVVSLQNYSGGVSYGGTYFQVQNITGNGVGWTNGFTQLGVLTPYWLNEDTVFAANGRMIITDNQQIGGNLGGFARHYSSGMDRIFGFNAFYDIDQSINDFNYRQTGIGVETLGQWWDFRANGYFPVTSGDNFVRPLALTNNMLYAGHQIAFAGTGLYEQALTGGDFEFGRPIFASTPWLRAYGGMYMYNAKGESPVGFRGRIESWISDDLSVGVMVTEDRQFNTNVNAVVNFLFSGWKPTRWFPNYTTRERMLMPVQRNWRIAAGTYEQILNIAAINPRTNQPYFVDWVDNSSTTAGPGDGTYENPYKTLQPNFPDADLILVNRGNTSPVTPLIGSVALNDFQRLLGEGSVHQFDTYANFGPLSIPLQTFNLPGFTNSGNMPYVSGGVGNFATLANANEVSSFNILNSAGAAITNTGVGSNNFNLNRLNLTNNAGGGIMLTQATSAGYITNVNARNNLAGGISIDSGAIPLTLAMNNVTSNGQAPGAQAFGIRLLADNSAIYAGLTNVTTTGNTGNGIDLTETNVGMQAVLTNVTSTGNGGDGLRADAVGNGLALSLNTVNTAGNADHGIYVSGSAAYISFNYTNLDDSFNGNDNLRFNLYNGSTLVGGGLTNTHFDSSAAGSGIVFYTDTSSQIGSATNFFNLQNITANGNNQSGMQMIANNASQQFINVIDGFFNNNGLDGTTTIENGGSGVVLNVDPTTMTGNGRDGFHFDVTGGSFLIGRFDQTQFDDNQNAGIYGNAGNALVNLTVTASTMQNTFPFAVGSQDYGMQLNLTNMTQFAATITDGSITNNLQQGILANVSGASPNTNSLTLTNVGVNGNGLDGLKATVQTGGNLAIVANASSFSQNGQVGAATGDGLDLTADTGSTLVASLTNSVVAQNSNQGILAAADNASTLGVGLNNTRVSQNSQNGVSATANAGSTLVINTATGTKIDDNALNGVVVTANASTFIGSFDGTSISHNLAGRGVSFTGAGIGPFASEITFNDSFVYHNQLDNFSFNVSAGHDLALAASDTTFSLSTAGRGIDGLITGNGTDVVIDQFLNVTSDNNKLDGMRLHVQNLATLNANINGGSFSENGSAGSDGVNVVVDTAGKAQICFDGTAADSNSDDGFDFTVSDAGSVLYAALQTSGTYGTLSASFNADQPVVFTINPDAAGGLFMDGDNTFNGNGSVNGITFTAIGTAGNHVAQAAFSYSGNSSDNAGDGVNVQMTYVDDAYIDIHDGTMSDNGSNGVDVALDNVTFGATNLNVNFLQGTLTARPFNISGLTMDGNAEEAIKIVATNVTMAAGTVDGNVITNSGADGILLDLTGGGNTITSFTFNENEVSNSQANGIDVQSAVGSTITTLSFTSNTLNNNLQNGSYLNLNGSTIDTLRYVDNILNGNGALGTGGGGSSNFNIDVVFLGGLTASQQAIFDLAAARWEQIITGDLPAVGSIDDVQISAEGLAIDGVGGILGQAGPTGLRAGSFLPYSGFMQFDTADLASLESAGDLQAVILHEMAHVLGFGTIWTDLGLLSGGGGADPQYTGTNAVAQYDTIFSTTATSVPVENTGGPGTADAHWRETVFKNELMTGFLSGTTQPISAVTVGQFQDLGYTVDYTAADAFTPSLVGGGSSTSLHLGSVSLPAVVITDPSLVPNLVASPNLANHVYSLASIVTPATSVGDGIHIEMTNGSAINNVVMTDNTINTNTFNGVNFATVDASNVGPITATGNTINQNGGDGFRLVDPNTANNTLTLAFTGNTINANTGNGIHLAVGNSQALTLTMPNGNTIGASGSGNGGMGVRLDLSDNSTFNVSVGTTAAAANYFAANHDAGFGMTLNDNAQGQISVVNSNFTNTVNGADANFDGQGFAIRDLVTNPLTPVTAINLGDASVANTTFNSNASDGFSLFATSSAIVNNVNVQRVNANLNDGDGMSFTRAGNAEIQAVTINNSRFVSNHGSGLEMTAAGHDTPPNDVYTLTNNILTDNDGSGMRFNLVGDGDITATVTGNTISNNGDSGIRTTTTALTTDTPSITFTGITQNIINKNTGSGISINTPHQSVIGGSLANANTITNNTVDGITITAGTFGANDTISFNTITGNGFDAGGTATGGDGINISASGYTGTIANNLISGSGDDGIAMTSSSSIGQSVTINNNRILSNRGDGVQISASGGSNNTYTLTANQINDNSRRGINVVNAAGTFDDSTVTTLNIGDGTAGGRNTIARNGLEGIYIINTADAAQGNATNINNLASATLLADGDPTARPVLNLNLRMNTIDSNGATLNSGNFTGTDTTGLVIRVGTSDALDFATSGNTAFTNNGGLADGTRGGVVAQVLNNSFAGNFGADVTFLPFISTKDPAITAGTWDNGAAPPEFLITGFQQDPLARLTLTYTGNTTDGLIATSSNNANVFYDTAEPIFKSRDTEQTDAGPFPEGGTRLRNATQLAGRTAPFDDPTTNILGSTGQNSNTFRYPGVSGSSTFQWHDGGGNTFGTILPGQGFGSSVPIGTAADGELPFIWSTF